MAALGLDRVVQPQHRRGGAAAQDTPAGLHTRVPGGEAERGPSLAGRDGMHPQAGAGDDPQGAFGPDEELGQIGADRCPWPSSG